MRHGKLVPGYSLAVFVTECSGTWIDLHDLEDHHAAEPTVSVEVRRWRTCRGLGVIQVEVVQSWRKLVKVSAFIKGLRFTAIDGRCLGQCVCTFRSQTVATANKRPRTTIVVGNLHYCNPS